MKKVITAALAMVLSLSFTACGKEEAEAPTEVTVPMLTEAVVPMLTEAPTLPPLTEAPTETQEEPPLELATPIPEVDAVPEETTAEEKQETPAETTAETTPETTEEASSSSSSGPDLSGIKGVGGKIVNVQRVNVRKHPSVKAEQVKQLEQGATVTVYEVLENDNAMWAHTNEGWIAKQYVKLDGPLPDPDPALGVHAKVYYTQKVNVRKEPSISSEKVAELARDTMVTVYETKKVGGAEWGRIDEGWVSMDYIKLPAGKVPPVASEDSNKTVG